MPEVPKGAKTPTDRQPAQSELIKPQETPEGWDLLRPPIDVDYWEQAELMSAAAEVKTRGSQVTLTAGNLKIIGRCVRLLQEELALDSTAFRTWVRSLGSFEAATEKLLPLLFAYVNALGEADSSAS